VAGQPSAQLTSPSTSQTLNSENLDVIDILSTPSTAAFPSSYYHHGYPNSPTSSTLSCSRSAPFLPHQERLYVHPIEWTLEETVNWLRSKGFEPDVCEKFIEQETTGDALLNLNVASLKTEIGIVAYGQRFRIANAIDELRRVASIRFPSVKLSTLSRSSSQAVQQMSGLKPFLLRSSSMGNLLSPSAQSISSYRPKPPILQPCQEPDPDVLSIVQKPTKDHAKVETQSRISPSPSPGSGQGESVVSVYSWWRRWDDCIDGI